MRKINYWLAVMTLFVGACLPDACFPERPSTTCNDLCERGAPEGCTGVGQILSVNESGEEEPLGSESYWMCVCAGQDNLALQYVVPRTSCLLPRGSTAYGEGEAGYVD